MPFCEKTIKAKVMQYSETVAQDIRKDISKKKELGETFSLSLDEWTSGRNRRYLALNLHTSQQGVIRLGLIRVKGSFPATSAAELIKKEVKNYGLDVEQDIVCLISDGASVMKKLGRELGISHQLCLSHGLHLAVVKVLYQAAKETARDAVEEEDEQAVAADEDDANTPDDSTSNLLWEEEDESADPILAGSYRDVVRKVRKIAVFFHRSPLRNDELHKICKEESKGKLNLVVDVKTRWNSLLSMLRRFHEMKGTIAKALVQLSAIDMYPSASDLELISQMIEALEVIETGSLALGRQDCDLRKADRIYDFTLSSLLRQESSIGQELYQAVFERIMERRVDVLSSLMSFLDEPGMWKSIYLNVQDRNKKKTLIWFFPCRLLWNRARGGSSP